jgi:hypothetical protein
VVNYCTLAELKAALGILDAVDDASLNLSISSASRFVDQHCERPFAAAAGTATRVYVPSSMYAPLAIDDATAVLEVRIDEDLDGSFATALAPADYQLEPVNGQLSGIAWPFTTIRPFEDGYWPLDGLRSDRATVRVTATYGWPAVPDAVRQATIMQAGRLFTRFKSPLGIAGWGDMGAVRVSYKVDPDVAMLLAPFRRHRVA